LLSKAIDLKREGFRSESDSVFFAFALLTPIAKREDRQLITSLLSLPDASVIDLVSDLCTEALPHLIANFFKEGDASETIDWMNRLSENANETHFEWYSIYPALKVAATRGYLDRTTAIDTLVSQLRKRADKREDSQSALIVYELIDLSARNLEAVDAVVQSSFANKQVNLDMIDIECWNDSDLQVKDRSAAKTWIDPAAELCSWSYGSLSDDLDPLNATFRANEAVYHHSSFDESSVLEWIDQLRKSTDQNFPREAVQSLRNKFDWAYHATMDLIREEMARYQEQNDADSWIGNGAYLGLVHVVVNQMPLPTDVMQTILRMPQSDRERIFGDQFGLIVQATALTPWKQMGFVEQWIWDADRSDPDRREMVDVYLFACYKNLMDRETAIETLVEGLQRALEEDPVLVAPYATNLAFLTPQEHSQLLEKAFQRDDTDWFYSLSDLKRLATDSDFANSSLKERLQCYRGVTEIIAEGVMFDEVLVGNQRRSSTPVTRVDPAELLTPSVKMIRNEARTSRNDKCPCGSGKKFKKCCLYKPAT
jgi:hypothetical protein